MSGASIEIYIYLLKRSETPLPGQYARMMIAAPSESAARGEANAHAKDEGYVWNDGTLTSCDLQGTAVDGVSGLMMASTEEED
jgi:hypothetical protein